MCDHAFGGSGADPCTSFSPIVETRPYGRPESELAIIAYARSPVYSLASTVRHAFVVDVGYTHASIVIPVVRSRSWLSPTVTQSLTPSNDSALPFFPVPFHVAPEIDPA